MSKKLTFQLSVIADGKSTTLCEQKLTVEHELWIDTNDIGFDSLSDTILREVSLGVSNELDTSKCRDALSEILSTVRTNKE